MATGVGNDESLGNGQYDPEVDIYYTNGSELQTRNNLKVNFSSSHDRKCLSELYENKIEKEWNRRCDLNSTLWNGSKFRLHAADSTEWKIGLTCYRDLLGTNYSPDGAEITKLGEQLGDPGVHHSNPLGVGAVLITSDNMIIIMRRSETVGEYPGRFDIPGGHPEPQRVFHTRSYLHSDLPPLTSDLNSLIVKEIFDSILEEIVSEVNIPADKLGEAGLMGVARNPQAQYRPSSEYIVRTSLTGEEVVSLYNEGSQQEADETTGIKLLTEHEVLNIRQSELWNELAPSAKGCFALYLHHLQCIRETRPSS